MQFCRRVVTFASQKQLANFLRSTSTGLVRSLRPRIPNRKIAASGAAVLAVGWFGRTEKQPDTLNPSIITIADELYESNKFREVYQLLKEHEDTNDVEILWRLCRVGYNISQEQATTAEERKLLVHEAYTLIERALALNEDHFAVHKWMSVLLDAKSGYDGIKARITNLEAVKQHMMRAFELNKTDATILYMIGSWCYQIADMPWYQRKIASTIFASPPDSSYTEALEYFALAEKTEPRFYSQNLLMLGKTYLKLNEVDQARYYLDLALHYPACTDDDQLAKKEAFEHLKKLKSEKGETVV